ncbi:MAG TPA: twin-arginine translocase subunit TatC [Candidatus Saccharimonadales bacterium]|nr:twin-arginine translocase subunit TatC [Candidatus Saccharimonadales bacterium]
MSNDEATMTLLDHLEELRRRLIIIIIAILVAAVAGFVVSGSVLDLLRSRLPVPYQTIYFTGPADAFGVQVKIAGFIGIALAMPVILFQVWRFVTPGLTRSERRVVWPVMIAAIFLFALGIVVGFLIVPFAMAFLIGFARPGLQPLITIDGYIGFVTTMLLAFGIVLEFPILLVGLARVGILNHKRLASQRRIIIVGITVFAIVVTPGGDPISPTILGSVMYLLFEGSLLVIRLIGR